MYLASDARIVYSGNWSDLIIPAEDLGGDKSATYRTTRDLASRVSFTFNGQEVELTYFSGPENGMWFVLLDGQPILDEDTGQDLTINAYSPTLRYGESVTIAAPEPGEHTLELYMAQKGGGDQMGLASIEVLPPPRQSNLGVIIGMIFLVQLLGLLLAILFGRALFTSLADKIDTKRGILIALSIYAIIAIWGYFLNSVFEFWFLAWMVAVVQGGSQALSRSLFSSMSPAAKSGEFFGFFSIMEKFSAIIGPLLFAFAAATFDNSRPAVLSIIAFFIIGGYLLTRVNVEEGRRVAKAEDAALLRLNNG